MSLLRTRVLKGIQLLAIISTGGIVLAQSQPVTGVGVLSPKQQDDKNQFQLSLNGDRDSVIRLITEDDSSNPVSNRFLEIICAQNGAGSDLFARQLFWSGNIYNQIRSTYWIKNRTVQHVKAVLLGNIIIPKESSANKHRDRCQNLLSAEYQALLVREDVKARIMNDVEKNMLESHAVAALSGSTSDARTLCEYYSNEFQRGLPIASIFGYDWMELCQIEVSGFPGADPSNKYLYWLQVSAENGDAESQWNLSKIYDRSRDCSKTRGGFWLRRSVEGGFKPAITKCK